jgi:ankyrin repeat protein
MHRLLHAYLVCGADVNARNSLGSSLLHEAACAGRVTAVALLLCKKVRDGS